MKIFGLQCGLTSMLFLIGASILILFGCKKENTNPVTITFDYSGQKAPGNFTGIFIATGGIHTSGTSLMTVQSVGDEFNCIYTLTSKDGGTIIMFSNCQMATNTGTWRILSGTGAYTNIRGNGTLIMTYPGAGVAVKEVFEGTIVKR
ncbi:MAG: hypothetical protein WKF70_13850 [Chitinophagaceae bacterium]